MPIMSCSLLSMSPSLTLAAHSAASCSSPAAASSSALCFPSGNLPMILRTQFKCKSSGMHNQLGSLLASHKRPGACLPLDVPWNMKDAQTSWRSEYDK